MVQSPTPLFPKYLFLSLQPPAEVLLGTAEWNIKDQIRIRGILVEGNDTPWGSFADLLVDLENRCLVGLTYQIDNRQYWRPMQEVAERLNPDVVHYNDISSASAQGMYPGEAGKAHRFEIVWSPARRLGVEIAQLMCGQWFWCYATEGNWGISPPLLALGITDIDDILKDHDLTFPGKLSFPQLAVTLA
jgi:hypothetical protein